MFDTGRLYLSSLMGVRVGLARFFSVLANKFPLESLSLMKYYNFRGRTGDICSSSCFLDVCARMKKRGLVRSVNQFIIYPVFFEALAWLWNPSGEGEKAGWLGGCEPKGRKSNYIFFKNGMLQDCLSVCMCARTPTRKQSFFFFPPLWVTSLPFHAGKFTVILFYCRWSSTYRLVAKSPFDITTDSPKGIYGPVLKLRHPPSRVT